MAQGVRCSLGKGEDLRADAQNQGKPGWWAHTSVTPADHREMGDTNGRTPKAHLTAGQVEDEYQHLS